MSNSILTFSKKNGTCADCNSLNSSWYNFIHRVFICTNCAGVHRGLPNQGVRVKSVDLDNWAEEELIEVERYSGNIAVNERFERFLPVYYPKQGDSTPPDIRREFITHKYVKETFRSHSNFLKYAPASGHMEGVLEKKGKDKSLWKPRHFILSPLSIEYYLETRQSEPKSRLPISQLEVHIEPCERNKSCLVLTQLSDTGVSGRNYYVRASGGDSLFDWYFAVLTAQSAKDQSVEKINFEETKTGNLYKVGGRSLDLWKLRWFSLNGPHVTYSTDKMSATPQGDFVLGPASRGFRVEAETSHRVRAPHRYTFQVVTLERTYKLCAESVEQRDSWMHAFERAIHLQQDF